MKYMIHCCNERQWYVEEYLVPSMVEQGINREDIIIWNDGKKNLESWVNSCRYVRDNLKMDEGTWHLQDDVLICRDFYERTKEVYNNFDIKCGFLTYEFNKDKLFQTGCVSIRYSWMSFPCMYIPNKYCSEFVFWFETSVIKDGLFAKQYATGKMDDFFFTKYIRTQHSNISTYNMYPCLVDHIDYLIGGSTINGREHKKRVNRAYYFDDKDLVDKLEAKLRR